MNRQGLPSVGVVIPTRDRPELLRRAIASVVDQDYAGPVVVVVVHDRSKPDRTVESSGPGGDAGRVVRVMENGRTPGLAGARNSGILSLDTDLVAFLDDDDLWLPGKLAAQVSRFTDDPTVEFAATAIEVEFRDGVSARTAGSDEVTYGRLLRSRMAMLHSSTFMARRPALVGHIGLIDETIPGSMCEDWDILLRAAARRPVAMVDEPLVRVLWGRTSFFAQRWETKIAAHRWMLERHPDIARDRIGAGRVYGQLAFSHAAIGRRRESLRWSARALRSNPREPRAILSALVAARVTSADRVLSTLHKRGRGI